MGKCWFYDVGKSENFKIRFWAGKIYQYWSSTVPPVSRLWSCQSGESNLRARIIGDVQAGIRLRPVNSMHLEMKKGSPRCAVKLLFRNFIKTVPNILQKILQEAISIKNHHFSIFCCSWHLPLGFSWLILVSAVTDVEFKTFKLFCFTKSKISPSKTSREIYGVIITMSWVWLIFRQLRQWEYVDVWKHSVEYVKRCVIATFGGGGCFLRKIDFFSSIFSWEIVILDFWYYNRAPL